MADNAPTFLELPLTGPAAGAVFHCPGDPQPISRAVHLARMAAGFAACRACPRRDDAGSLPKHVVRPLRQSRGGDAGSLITPAGIRGVSLNELTRERIARMVEHILDLADADARQLHSFPPPSPACSAGPSFRHGEGERREGERASGPIRVVVGHDARPFSPDLAIGVVAMLRRWGCEIADLSQVSRPCFDFACDRFGPDLGLYVTGGTSPHNWNGLDILGPSGLPWSPGQLTRLAARLGTEPARLRRRQGNYHPLAIRDEYEESLREHFHALRPFRIVLACGDPLTRGTLERLLKGTPCTVHSTNPSGSRIVADAIRVRHADLGFLIGTDGRTCTLFDERGEMFSTDRTSRLLAAKGDDEGRYSFPDESPQCDSVLTLARLLQAFSTSDRLVSDYRGDGPRGGR